MPFDLTTPDLLALAWFFLAWSGFTVVLDHLRVVPPPLNRHMSGIRGAWMRNMVARDNRVMDSMLLGHLISSVSFFASTTALLLAGLLGALAAAEEAHRVISGLGFTVRTTAAVFELKLLLLLVIFVFAFFKFTWALRQYNYACALVGAAPSGKSPEGEAAAAEAASVLSLAVLSFNGGLRAYYFAFATLGWFVHPLAYAVLTAGILVVLVRRQYFSPAARAVRRYGELVRKS
ncbi:MAG TPA: DUF599 family protein [Azospirillaceae bacterium]|nr:DUF599 family protein [Azospirillaceae bacterium]